MTLRLDDGDTNRGRDKPLFCHVCKKFGYPFEQIVLRLRITSNGPIEEPLNAFDGSKHYHKRFTTI